MSLDSSHEPAASGGQEQAIVRRRSFVKLLLKAMRVHQWVKNILIFVPLLMAFQILDVNLAIRAAGAFIAFSLMASGTYLFNDLMDLEADRAHPTKRHRPFASGALSVRWGQVLIPALVGAGLVIGWFLSVPFLIVLVGYTIITLTYSLRLKRLVLVDVLVLAGLYTWRIFAGAIAAGVALSAWLLAFSMFMFFSLALLKRTSELLEMRAEGKLKASGRGYHVDDLSQLTIFGSTSGYISVLVLALYINSDAVRALYHRPEALWLICPLILYWVSRVWLIGHRGQMHSDPIVFALKDRVSYGVGAIVVGLLAIGHQGW
jgi:4-hydroxybenzoate polyprenyltransferase